MAIVCSVHAFHDAAFTELEKYQHDGGIIVAYDLPVALACDQVIFERRDNAYQAARYLLDHGHRKLGLGMSRLVGARDSNINSTQNQRLAGFGQALAEADVRWRDEWIFENEPYEGGGVEMARRFLEMKDRPTGLFIVNDHVALAFMVEIMRAGVRVPGDLSIIGQDDQPIATFCPVPLTSVSQPAQEIVDGVVKRLQERLNGDTSPPHTLTIRGRLVERQSVAGPPS